MVTHDVATITKHAYDRVRSAQPMPGVFEVGPSVAIGRAMEDLLLIVECSTAKNGPHMSSILMPG